jgi:hypothetical protein
MATTYTAVTNIVPITTITNVDMVALFVPFKEGSGGDPELDLSASSVRQFNDPGDISIGGGELEQVTLEIGGKLSYEINGTYSQGELTFPYVPDPVDGPPSLLGLDSSDVQALAMSPQGVLYIAKLDTSVTASTGVTYWRVWGMVGANFVSADAINWTKGNAQQATARFKCTGSPGVWGFDNCLDAMKDADNSSTGHVKITVT